MLDCFQASGLRQADVAVVARGVAVLRFESRHDSVATSGVIAEGRADPGLDLLAESLRRRPAGKAQFAVNYALSLPDVSKRIEGLGLIAEALAGVPDPDNDPFDFSAINTPM